MRGTGANFLSDRLILQKVPITAKIPKNNFSLTKGGDSGIENQVNFGVLFMNKLKSAVEHLTDKANALFEGELYGVPPCFSVNCTDQMYQGKKSSILERPQSYQLPSGDGVIPKALALEASPLFPNLANVDVPNFHEFGIVFYNNSKQVVNTFDRVDIVCYCYFPNSVKV